MNNLIFFFIWIVPINSVIFPNRPLGVNSLRIADDYTKNMLVEDSFLMKIDNTIYDNASRWDGDVVFNARGKIY